jgi:hypothetical protein
MQNVVFHITIPAGLKLVAGNRLMKEITFDFISRLDPYYSSVDYVKLTAGPSISKLSETTIASQIYKSSKQAKLIVPFHIPWEGPQHERLVEARTQYTTLLASRDLLLNIISLLGPGAHVLANFSVDRKADNTKHLDQLNKDLKTYEITLRSHGRVVPGGHAKFQFAAKGVWDLGEKTPGRNWSPNGMGANSSSPETWSNTGGRGKPVKMFASPICSPSLFSMRQGCYQTGFSIAQMGTGFGGFSGGY